jgi:hypothetical protein
MLLHRIRTDAFGLEEVNNCLYKTIVYIYIVAKSHIVIMQRTQSKISRAIANAPWYVTNHTLHSDLKVPYVCDVIQERIGKHHIKLEDHPNPLLEPLLQPTYNRRLDRFWTFDVQDTWGDIAGCTPHHFNVSRPHISLKTGCNPSDCW